LILGLLEAFLLLITFRPNVIFSKGGYVSVPVCLMGWVLRIPMILHESDHALGKANRMLLRFARRLCVSAPQQEIGYMDIATRFGIPVTATGNPIRAALLHGSRDAGRRITGFSGKKPVFLIIGGSQGSRTLNEAVREHLSPLLDRCDIIHLTGRGKAKRIPHARYFVREWADRELPDLYALADIVLSRAGAGVTAELAALGKAVILVPIPDLAHGHQSANAHSLDVAGAAIVLPQKRLTELLVSTVTELATNEKKRREVGQRLSAFAVPDAAGKVARIILHEAEYRNIGVSE
jgi:UDP-N-acetylglucosamine--N-acetylmuramyl-(pentapeptide) pyrophosphoryl-undecaprenol N-acetylglucosamine transferase